MLPFTSSASDRAAAEAARLREFHFVRSQSLCGQGGICTSGLAPEDIQFAEVHDCFSIAELIHIEDLGFFTPGQAYKAVEQGATRLDGPMPINTSGGLKCKGHPVGATGVGQICEVWAQLRGEAGERQVRKQDSRFGAAQNLGGTGGTCTFTILERRQSDAEVRSNDISYSSGSLIRKS